MIAGPAEGDVAARTHGFLLQWRTVRKSDKGYGSRGSIFHQTRGSSAAITTPATMRWNSSISIPSPQPISRIWSPSVIHLTAHERRTHLSAAGDLNPARRMQTLTAHFAM